jgi:hypothetical protein
MQRINVGKDFSGHPIGRYREDGPESGEVFREDLLMWDHNKVGNKSPLQAPFNNTKLL